MDNLVNINADLGLKELAKYLQEKFKKPPVELKDLDSTTMASLRRDLVIRADIDIDSAAMLDLAVKYNIMPHDVHSLVRIIQGEAASSYANLGGK